MNGNLVSNLGAVALAIAGGLVGYFVPFVGTLGLILLILLIIAAYLDSDLIVDVVFAPLRALLRWQMQGGEMRWLRRAPFLGLVAGALARWLLPGTLLAGG
jgi:hypothetical protein